MIREVFDHFGLGLELMRALKFSFTECFYEFPQAVSINVLFFHGVPDSPGGPNSHGNFLACLGKAQDLDIGLKVGDGEPDSLLLAIILFLKSLATKAMALCQWNVCVCV